MCSRLTVTAQGYECSCGDSTSVASLAWRRQPCLGALGQAALRVGWKTSKACVCPRAVTSDPHACQKCQVSLQGAPSPTVGGRARWCRERRRGEVCKGHGDSSPSSGLLSTLLLEAGSARLRGWPGHSPTCDMFVWDSSAGGRAGDAPAPNKKVLGSVVSRQNRFLNTQLNLREGENPGDRRGLRVKTPELTPGRPGPVGPWGAAGGWEA